MLLQFGDNAYGTSLLLIVVLSLLGTVPFMIKPI
jgi:hypothetical protein